MLSRVMKSIMTVLQFLGQLLAYAQKMMSSFFPFLRKKRRLRSWMIVRRGKHRAAATAPELLVTEKDIEYLLKRIQSLDDCDRISERAVGFSGSGEDFFASPERVMKIIEELILANPPFLHVARILPEGGEDESSSSRTEYLIHEADVMVSERLRLYIPQVRMEHLESQRPPGYPVPRFARSLADIRQAALLYQTLPEDLLIARLVEGSIPLLAYREERKMLLFREEERIVTRKEHRTTRVAVPIEEIGQNQNTRLMYMLFDRSTSLVRNCIPKGENAVMELAIAVTMIRADLGRPEAKYYFRAFAERMDPLAIDPPVVASSVTEKEHLVERLFAVNFSGEATNVVDALMTAICDIEMILKGGDIEILPRICLLTDGRASIYREVGVRLKQLGIGLDVILIGRESFRNAELEKIASTISFVDPSLYTTAMKMTVNS
jgi:hypothetical protein